MKEILFTIIGIIAIVNCQQSDNGDANDLDTKTKKCIKKNDMKIMQIDGIAQLTSSKSLSSPGKLFR